MATEKWLPWLEREWAVDANVRFRRPGEVGDGSTVSLEETKANELRDQREQFPQLKVKLPR